MKKAKGVSPIVAVLLLIVIAVAAAAVTYGFVMGFIGGATTTTTTTQAMIRVDAVNASNDKISVYVRNVGSIPVTVDAIYVYHADGTLITVGKLSSSSPISPGTVAKIDADATVQLSAGETYYVKVTTKEGAIATSEIFKPKK